MLSRPISDNTLNAALRRLGYARDEATAHGFRASASTLLNQSGRWHPDAIERQLGHVEGNDVRAAYARGEHWNERVTMMQWWADNLDGLRRTNLQLMETFDTSAHEHAQQSRASCAWVESEQELPNRADFNSTCWLGGGQQECQSRIHKTCVTA